MLDLNIKSGNSLITDEFNWEKEFPCVFDGNGFDVVVSNPPYVRHHLIQDIKPALKKEYKCYHGLADIYVYFFEKAIKLLKENGVMGFICSNSYETVRYAEKLRGILLENNILKYVDYTGEKIFNVSVDTSSIFIQKSFDKNNNINVNDKYEIPQKFINNYAFTFEPLKNLKLRAKLKEKGITIKDMDIEMKLGIMTGYNDAFIIDEETRNKLINEDTNNSVLIKPLLRGRNIKRYEQIQEEFIIFIPGNINIKDSYSSIYEYLEKYREYLEKRAPSNQGKHWYNLRACVYNDLFSLDKIVFPRISSEPHFNYDTSGSIILSNSSMILSDSLDLKTILGLLNSKLIFWFLKNFVDTLGDNSYHFNQSSIDKIPLVLPNDDSIANRVDEMLLLKKKIRNNDGDVKEFEDRVSLLEDEIDSIVYDLYDLTDDEIAIIEGSF